MPRRVPRAPALPAPPVFSLFICALFASHAVFAQPPETTRGPAPMTVSVATAKTQCFVDRLRLEGFAVAREEIALRPEYEGLQLAQILVEDGASVSAGQPLAQLTRPDWLPGLPTKTTMTAPAAGTVLVGRIAVGMPASAKADPMFTIARGGELEAEARLPLGALARVKPGQIARIVALDGAELAGSVRLVLPQVDPMLQQGRARIQLSSWAGLRPGAFVTAIVDAGQSCGPAAPLSAILYGPEGAIVQAVRGDRVETRRVRLGLSDATQVEIVEGLEPGDVVVARAGAFLREGDLVRPAP
ncbi:efflux RND transporter periplasmic adaptor subunit [Methylocella sp.]|uniref:efflux RND transporter periplasmic adaptor subunit n=1 Tax=Methylocella sp. TaxID=1978226 RepID=UPI0037837412